MSLLGPDGRKQLRTASRVSAVGLEMGLALTFGYLVGRWADGRFDTGPWLTYLGLVLGLTAGARGFWQLARRAHAASLREEG